MASLRDISTVISKRALQRLAEAQRTLTVEMRSLTEQHSRFIGALMACDAATQQASLVEYRDQLYSVHAALARLRIMLERHCDDLSDAAADTGAGTDRPAEA